MDENRGKDSSHFRYGGSPPKGFLLSSELRHRKKQNKASSDERRFSLPPAYKQQTVNIPITSLSPQRFPLENLQSDINREHNRLRNQSTPKCMVGLTWDDITTNVATTSVELGGGIVQNDRKEEEVSINLADFEKTTSSAMESISKSRQSTPDKRLSKSPGKSLSAKEQFDNWMPINEKSFCDKSMNHSSFSITMGAEAILQCTPEAARPLSTEYFTPVSRLRPSRPQNIPIDDSTPVGGHLADTSHDGAESSFDSVHTALSLSGFEEAKNAGLQESTLVDKTLKKIQGFSLLDESDNRGLQPKWKSPAKKPTSMPEFSTNRVSMPIDTSKTNAVQDLFKRTSLPDTNIESSSKMDPIPECTPAQIGSSMLLAELQQAETNESLRKSINSVETAVSFSMNDTFHSINKVLDEVQLNSDQSLPYFQKSPTTTDNSLVNRSETEKVESPAIVRQVTFAQPPIDNNTSTENVESSASFGGLEEYKKFVDPLRTKFCEKAERALKIELLVVRAVRGINAAAEPSSSSNGDSTMDEDLRSYYDYDKARFDEISQTGNIDNLKKYIEIQEKKYKTRSEFGFATYRALHARIIQGKTVPTSRNDETRYTSNVTNDNQDYSITVHNGDESFSAKRMMSLDNSAEFTKWSYRSPRSARSGTSKKRASRLSNTKSIPESPGAIDKEKDEEKESSLSVLLPEKEQSIDVLENSPERPTSIEQTPLCSDATTPRRAGVEPMDFSLLENVSLKNEPNIKEQPESPHFEELETAHSFASSFHNTSGRLSDSFSMKFLGDSWPKEELDLLEKSAHEQPSSQLEPPPPVPNQNLNISLKEEAEEKDFTFGSLNLDASLSEELVTWQKEDAKAKEEEEQFASTVPESTATDLVSESFLEETDLCAPVESTDNDNSINEARIILEDFKFYLDDTFTRKQLVNLFCAMTFEKRAQGFKPPNFIRDYERLRQSIEAHADVIRKFQPDFRCPERMKELTAIRVWLLMFVETVAADIWPVPSNQNSHNEFPNVPRYFREKEPADVNAGDLITAVQELLGQAEAREFKVRSTLNTSHIPRSDEEIIALDAVYREHTEWLEAHLDKYYKDASISISEQMTKDAEARAILQELDDFQEDLCS